jgi:hypothetical protein
MLKLSLQIFYRRYHELVDRYEISIPQMAIDLFPLPTRYVFNIPPLGQGMDSKFDLKLR